VVQALGVDLHRNLIHSRLYFSFRPDPLSAENISGHQQHRTRSPGQYSVQIPGQIWLQINSPTALACIFSASMVLLFDMAGSPILNRDCKSIHDH
jgi:hypothetical protein